MCTRLDRSASLCCLSSSRHSCCCIGQQAHCVPRSAEPPAPSMRQVETERSRKDQLASQASRVSFIQRRAYASAALRVHGGRSGLAEESKVEEGSTDQCNYAA